MLQEGEEPSRTWITFHRHFDLDLHGERWRYLGAQCDVDREVRPRSGAHPKGNRSRSPQRDGLDAPYLAEGDSRDRDVDVLTRLDRTEVCACDSDELVWRHLKLWRHAW